MRNLGQDLRLALRMMRRAPVFTALVLATVAFGTGANTAVFSVVNAVLLRSLPYQDPQRLVTVWQTERSQQGRRLPSAPADLFDYRHQARSFAGLVGFHNWNYNLTGEGDPEQIPGAAVGADLFRLLGVEPALGRGFRPEEDRPGGEPAVVIGHGLWQRRFGSSAQVLGRSVTLNGQIYPVVGVMPPGFDFPDGAQLWAPLAHSPEGAQRGFQYLKAVGRLAPQTRLAGARAELATIASRLAAQYPDTNAGRGVELVPLVTLVVGDVRPALLILMGTVVVVLAMACANVASLLAVRFRERAGDLAVRAALGGSRRHLLRPLVVEGLLFAFAGAGLGVALAVWGVRVLTRLAPGKIPRLGEAGIDGPVLLFTLGLTVASGLIFGLLPALRASKPDLQQDLREGGLRSRAGGRRARGLLVVGELALALTLLIVAGLLVQSFLRLRSVAPGFNPHRVLTLWLSLPQSRYPEAHQAAAFYSDLRQRLRALPGVESVAMALSLPMSTGMKVDNRFTIAGRPVAPGEEPAAMLRPVSSEYFRTLEIPVLEGRSLGEQDDAGAPPVVVVNQTMARRFWPDGTPVGERLTVGAELGPVGRIPEISREIVGVVGDVKHAGLDAETLPEIYLATSQTPWWMSNVVVRTAGDPLAMANAIRAEVWAGDRDLPIARLQTLAAMVDAAVERPRFTTLLSSLFAAIALLLAMGGVYGVVSHSVNQRRHEIGVRVALGAEEGTVLGMVLRQVMKLALVGLALGVALAAVASRLLASQLFGVTPTDPLTFAGLSALLAAITLLAGYLPARRASRVAPVTALHAE